MKIVVIGGTGLIGSKLIRRFAAHGHDAVAAAPSTGVNTLTGEGLDEVLTGADVVVDVSNSPSFEPAAVLEFFTTSTTNVLAAEQRAGAGHHVALSIVGTERLPGNGYFAAKIAQEDLIVKSGVPYSLVHATQFFEFTLGIADAATTGSQVRIAPVKYQPMAGDDVADAVARIAAGTPLNGRQEIAGPDQVRMDEFVREALALTGDPREVVADEHATYFGSELREGSLVPEGDGAQLGHIHYADWVKGQAER
ncbi:SDR family oxidoreductase [Kribbella sp. DT2]|uniref:SDR family oxidoreductase n=1 Tax=Kribbella sp. DT2 TaxID=3393427 RepID=UPI003CF4BF74